MHRPMVLSPRSINQPMSLQTWAGWADKTVALEAADQDITCNAICPGFFVLTPLVVIERVAAHQQITGLDFEAAGLDLIKENTRLEDLLPNTR